MKFRTSEICISKGTRRCLVAIAKVGGKEGSTADEIGDKILSEHLAEHYPILVQRQKEIEKLESQLTEAVKG